MGSEGEVGEREMGARGNGKIFFGIAQKWLLRRGNDVLIFG